MLQKITGIVILVHYLMCVYIYVYICESEVILKLQYSNYFRNTFNLLKIREMLNMSLPI